MKTSRKMAYMLAFAVALIMVTTNEANIIQKFKQSVKKPTASQGVVSWNFGSFIHPENSSVEFDLKFFSPTLPGNYSTIMFLTGLDGIAPSFLYEDFCTKLVLETNSIIVAYDAFRFPYFPDKEERVFERTLNWTLANLNQLFNSKKTPASIKDLVFPDLETYGVSLMSHSAAGHTVVSYLVNICGYVKSLILMDPVDGFDPFGIVKIFVTNPPEQLSFTIPTLMLSTGLSNVPVSAKLTSCAPTNISNERFYTCLPGPTWYLNFTDYGHADILDDWARKYVASLICTPCKIKCDFPLYRKNVVRAISYFLSTLDFRNQTTLNALQNPTQSGMFDPEMNIKAHFKTNGYDVLKLGQFCVHSG